MDDWFIVLGLSFAMLVGCYLAGCIPLAFSFSEDRLKLLTIFGAGLLVGAALAIIVPEGINAMYSGHKHENMHISVKVPEEVNVQVEKRSAEEVPLVAGLKEEGHHLAEEEHHDGHKYIGVSLVTGFIFMLLIDQIGGGHAHAGADAEAQMGSHTRNKFTATLGLCVHAAADGIAMGAASSVSQTGLTILVFVAIMLHKAPAAFGLVSFLMHDGLERNRIRKHLFAFSAAAPIGTIITFFFLNRQNKEVLADVNATGIAMLFSAGTFLYVATVHILPEVSSKRSSSISTDGTVIVREHKGFTKSELLAIVVGSLLPVGISLGHSH